MNYFSRYIRIRNKFEPRPLNKILVLLGFLKKKRFFHSYMKVAPSRYLLQLPCLFQIFPRSEHLLKILTFLSRESWENKRVKNFDLYLLLIPLFFYNEKSVPDNNICVTNSWKQAFTVSHKSSNGTRERKTSLFLPRDIKKQPMWGHVSSD